MQVRWAVGVTCAMLILALATVQAQDKPKDTATEAKEAKPDAKPDAKPKAARLVQPWSKLTTLTDEQKTQIRDIHAKAVDEINAIRKKERADIVALLSDAQKSELAAMEEKDAADRKTRGADRTTEEAEKP